MTTLNKRAGAPNSPIPGTSTYQTDLWIGATMHFFIWNNIPQNDLWEFDPDYIFDPVTGTIDVSPRGNTWDDGGALIFAYTPKCHC